jgi:hypothetical protein
VELDLYQRIAPIETNVSNLEKNIVPIGGIILFNKEASIPTSWKRLTDVDYDV